MMQQTTSLLSIFTMLQGSWKIHRAIPGHGIVNGIANFTGGTVNQLFYKEGGTFIQEQGKQFNIQQEYLYTYYKKQISVYFCEGSQKNQLFYHLNKLTRCNDKLHLSASYLCNLDLYQLAYDFAHQNEFNLRYVVTGPKKNYTINTLYHRIS